MIIGGSHIHELGAAHGVTGIAGDGNDADAVYALAGGAVARARSGEGPSIIELATYRWMEHCGPGDDIGLGYRDAEELAAWQARDPVRCYRERLTQEEILSGALDSSYAAEIGEEIEGAFDFARQSPFPAPDALARHILPG